MASGLLGALVGPLADAAQSDDAPSAAPPAQCLPTGDGYLKARLSGALAAEIDWGNDGTECTGATRPDGGLRLRFSRYDAASASQLVLVFGIAGLKEGEAAKSVPVNLTIIREGAGEFYGTQGDDKCALDEVRQIALVGPPFRTRRYRVVARGYCTEPARAVQGKGAVLLSRFDFAGIVAFDDEDPSTDPTPSQQ
jgi:hypothetical protein